MVNKECSERMPDLYLRQGLEPYTYRLHFVLAFTLPPRRSPTIGMDLLVSKPYSVYLVYTVTNGALFTAIRKAGIEPTIPD